MEFLLPDPRVNPTAGNDYALFRACYWGHEKVVRLLLQDGRPDPATSGDGPLKNAVARGHIEVVRLLLSDQRVGSPEVIDLCLCDSYNRGDIKMVDLLLTLRGGTDPRDLSRMLLIRGAILMGTAAFGLGIILLYGGEYRQRILW